VIPRVTATIDLPALRHNLRRIRQWSGSARIMAVVKADGYGHDAVQVARALRELRTDAGARQDWEADAFAVACLEEALKLRQARVFAPIVVLEGVLSLEEARLCLRHQLQVVVHDHWQLSVLERLASGAAAQVWIKLDTGMHRLGFDPADLPTVCARLRARPEWTVCGWMTHLARADETDCDATSEQIARFEQALGDWPGPRSIANSAGLIAWPQARADWVRPGLVVYGASPLPGRTGGELGLRPVMRVESRILALRQCQPGDCIGYGGSYRCQNAMRIAVIAVGYADGVHRNLRQGTPMMLHGRRVPVVGRVSMDMLTVDVTEVPEAVVDDPVLLWGPELPVEEIAACAGTIPYEMLCGLTQRVHFRYVDTV
jgi:alanine racemase